jgi:hypothetical protein
VNPDYLDNSTEAKSRRNLLVAATATLLFANLKLDSNVLDILGLRFVVEPDRIVGIGQLLTLLLLTIFVLRFSPRIVELLKEQWSAYFSAKEHSTLIDMQYDLGWGADEGPPDRSPEGKYKAKQDEFARTREKRVRLFEFWQKLLIVLASALIDLLLPFVLGLLAIFNPYAVSAYLIPFAQSMRPN